MSKIILLFFFTILMPEYNKIGAIGYGIVKGQIKFRTEGEEIIGKNIPLELIPFEYLKELKKKAGEKFDSDLQNSIKQKNLTNDNLNTVKSKINSFEKQNAAKFTNYEYSTIIWGNISQLSYSDLDKGINWCEYIIENLNKLISDSLIYYNEISQMNDIKKNIPNSYLCSIKNSITCRVETFDLMSSSQKDQAIKLLDDNIKLLIDGCKNNALKKFDKKIVKDIDFQSKKLFMNSIGKCISNVGEFKKEILKSKHEMNPLVDRESELSLKYNNLSNDINSTIKDKDKIIGNLYLNYISEGIQTNSFNSDVSNDYGIFQFNNISSGLYKLFSLSDYGSWIIDVNANPGIDTLINLSENNAIYTNNINIIKYGEELIGEISNSYNDKKCILGISVKNIFYISSLNYLGWIRPANKKFLILLLRVKNLGNEPYNLRYFTTDIYLENEEGIKFEENSTIEAQCGAEEYISKKFRYPSGYTDRNINHEEIGYKVFTFDIRENDKFKYFCIKYTNTKNRFLLKPTKEEPTIKNIKYWSIPE